MELTNKTILIAGASAGIGRAVALALGKKGNRVIVTARRESRLQTLGDEIEAAGGQAMIIAADALNESEASAAVAAAVEKFGPIDCALLNIGDGPALNMATESATTVKTIMAINYDTMVNFLVPLIAQMKTQGYGHIAHTNSLAGFLGLPEQGPYSAAKAAGRILIDTCRVELAPFNIKFTSVYPGFVATERVANDGVAAPMEISEDKAGQHIIYALEKQKSDYLFPFPLRWLIRLARVLPKSLVGFLTGKMMREES